MKHLHSIYLTRGLVNSINIPHQISQNILSFKYHHPDSVHTLYDDDSLRTFIETHFDSDVLHAFDTLIPLAYKADLGRYCLLYQLGGVYADLAIYFYQNIYQSKNLQKLHVFRDGFSAVPWIISNSIIACPAKLDVFQLIIFKIVENCRQHYYGLNSLSPTGPNLWGYCLASTVDPADIICGDASRINKNKHHSFSYVSREGDVVAVAVKKGTGLNSLGHDESEDYNKYWAALNIYGELKGAYSIHISEFKIHYHAHFNQPRNNANIFSSGDDLESPHFSVSRGEYEIKFYFKKLAPLSKTASLTIELLCATTMRVIDKSMLISLQEKVSDQSLILQFNVNDLNQNLKVRICVIESVIMDFSQMTMTRVSVLS